MDGTREYGMRTVVGTVSLTMLLAAAGAWSKKEKGKERAKRNEEGKIPSSVSMALATLSFAYDMMSKKKAEK
jgi:hypothetical protein